MKMMSVVCKVLLAAVLVLLNTMTNLSVTGASPAQQEAGPRVENTKVETRNVAGTLASAIANAEKSAAAATWLGYSVKAVAGQRTICCGNFSDGNDVRCGKCELEAEHNHWNKVNKSDANANNGTVKLEGGEDLIVLFRLQDQHVTRIRLASDDCALDAGGLPFVWLKDVKAAESVGVLAEYVLRNKADERGRDAIGNEALTAIALHDVQEAERALESFVAPTQPEELRKQAAFWMGAARGKDGFAVLQRMAKSEPSTEVRAHVAFALSISKEPA